MVNQGDIITLNFDPQAGYEQKGYRPALVVSNEKFNKFSKMVMVCPITTTDKNHPFHVKLDDNTKTTGVILCDQSRILDINARNFEFMEKAPKEIVYEVVDIINSFIETCD